jgi:hypothetical protein
VARPEYNGTVISHVHLGLAAVCVALLSTACASSGADDSSSAPVTSVPAGALSSSSTPANPTFAAISKAYETFFSSASTTPQSQAALQHGEKFTKTLEEQAKSSFADKSSAKVDSVHLTSPVVAAVKFTISSGGGTLLSKAPGYAVKTGDTWQVAAQTFCGLLKLEGGAPAACDDAAVTALPH